MSAKSAAAIAENYGHFGELRDAVGEMEADDTLSAGRQDQDGRLPVPAGRFKDALGTLQNADGSAMALFYQARCLFEVGRYDDAIGVTSRRRPRVQRRPVQDRNRRSGTLFRSIENAMAILDNIFGPAEQTADYMYQRAATVAAVGGRLEEAITLYQRAIQTDENHAGALFGLALEYDRMGNDEESFALYERAAKAFPTGVGALINLGLAYEDQNQFDKAQMCYKRILDCYPDHPQTLLYMKDAAATGNMLV